jgi:WD40 repeat protein
VVHFTTHESSPFVIVGGASGALSIFDINQSKICYQQKEGFTSNELTKIFAFHKSSGRILVLNSDQQLVTYELVNSKKGSVRLSPLSSQCLYLDEIIDLRILAHPSDSPPRKALLCSNNELLKVVDLDSGQVLQTMGEDTHKEIILCVD